MAKQKQTEYFYKMNNTAGQVYLQIWRRKGPTGKGDYVCSLGSAQKCFEKLVKPMIEKGQTNFLDESQTNVHEENQEEETKRQENPFFAPIVLR